MFKRLFFLFGAVLCLISAGFIGMIGFRYSENQVQPIGLVVLIGILSFSLIFFAIVIFNKIAIPNNVTLPVLAGFLFWASGFVLYEAFFPRPWETTLNGTMIFIALFTVGIVFIASSDPFGNQRMRNYDERDHQRLESLKHREHH